MPAFRVNLAEKARFAGVGREGAGDREPVYSNDPLTTGGELPTRIGDGTDPLGPKPVPLLVGSLLIILAACLAVSVTRGHLGEQEAGEDIDLHAKADMKTVLLLVGVFAANIFLIDILGWVISGGLLFYGCAIVLGSRHFIRDLVIAAALSLGTFYGFAIGLGVGLPAGILQGIL